MATTPLGIYYDASKAIKHYGHQNGDVYVTTDGHSYVVTIIKQTSLSGEEYRARGPLDFLSASEFFKTAVRYIRGEIAWTEPVRIFNCKFNPRKSQCCKDKNCPNVLGGADYRYIFGTSCPFRKPPRTR